MNNNKDCRVGQLTIFVHDGQASYTFIFSMIRVILKIKYRMTELLIYLRRRLLQGGGRRLKEKCGISQR